MTTEKRYAPRTHAPKIVRADGKATISGYAAVFYRADDPGTEYQLYDDLYERIMPGAFDAAVREDDVRGLVNHDPDNILGRTKSGTMTLAVDKIGLRYDIPVDENDPDHARWLRKIERGDIDGSSFAFRVYGGKRGKVVWVDTAEREIREIHDLELFDVGPVTYPAYAASTAGVRAEDLAEVRSAHAVWKGQRDGASEIDAEAEADEVDMRLRLLAIDE